MEFMQDISLFANQFCMHDGEDDYDKLKEVIQFFKKPENCNTSGLELLNTILCEAIKRMVFTKCILVSSMSDEDPKVVFNDKLELFCNEALHILKECVRNNNDKTVQMIALKVLISCLPLQAKCGANSKFPINNFVDILTVLLETEHNFKDLKQTFNDYFTYRDISVSFWNALEATVCRRMKCLTEDHVSKVLNLVELHSKVTSEIKRPFCEDISLDSKKQKKQLGLYVRNVWERISSIKNVSPDVQQELLLSAIEFFMPIINEPIMLTDYFMYSFNIGGSVGIVALQGIFTLIQKFNIDYPNVYDKLYTMFQPGMFATPYKARFYHLSNIFLSSSHLPQVMVAGFIKRMSRLSLVAPPEDTLVIIAFITNLLIRHPGLKFLLNKPGIIPSVSEDPYLYEEEGQPSNSHAMESSLWEIALLQEHALPSVSTAAITLLTQPLSSVEKDLAPLLDSSSSTIFSRECKKKMKEPPVTFEKPASILVSNKDSPFNFWSF